ncbi:MAG: ATP-grasp domain-containing protein [Bacillus sp. (in: Bacteria)]|nr:ATP-grasp domain-containing protein [Bacillus sp. (in: firmicutes)]
MRKTVLFIYNYVPKENMTDDLKECASENTVAMLENAIKDHSYEVINVNLKNENQLLECIHTHSPIAGAFVIAEGYLDSPHTLYDGSGALSIRKVLESYSIPYTHSTPSTMEACRNKDLTYEMLEKAGVSIPKYFSMPTPAYTEELLTEAEKTVGYPMFVKPTGGGNSLGIDELSICLCREDLVNKMNQLASLIGEQPVLIETFLSGREFTVAVIGNEQPNVLPIIEFPDDVQVRSHAVKSKEHEKRDSFKLLSIQEDIGLEIASIALQVFKGLQGKDMIRLDMKTDSFGKLYVIDVNGTPSLSLNGSAAFMVASIEITIEDLVGFLLKEIMKESDCNTHIKSSWEKVHSAVLNTTQLAAVI